MRWGESLPLSLEEPVRENGEAIKIYGLVKRPTENLICHPLWRFIPEEEVSRKEEYIPYSGK
jgi:hypothetical protein